LDPGFRLTGLSSSYLLDGAHLVITTNSGCGCIQNPIQLLVVYFANREPGIAVLLQVNKHLLELLATLVLSHQTLFDLLVMLSYFMSELFLNQGTLGLLQVHDCASKSISKLTCSVPFRRRQACPLCEELAVVVGFVRLRLRPGGAELRLQLGQVVIVLAESFDIVGKLC